MKIAERVPTTSRAAPDRAARHAASRALFVRPEGPPIAPVGLTAAGLGLGGIIPTGTVTPGERWDPVTFLELVMAAVVP